MTRSTDDDGMAATAEASASDTTADGRGRGLAAAATASAAAPDDDAAHERPAGTIMGRYAVVGVLGAGGMGRVYRARDPDLNRDLAIKVLRRGPGSSSGGLERRLLREAQAMAKLDHPNLATVYDVGIVDGEVFIAFEFIDGGTLGTWARAPGRSFSARLAALVAAGRGLEAAHSAGVIHRDFKPDNVLVRHDGAVKVVDFGLARGVNEAGATLPPRGDELTSDLTLTGSILGTPAYMAPEQHHGTVADARADQFGFGVAAWEVLYGERPFQGKTLTAMATAICEGHIAPRPATAEGPAAVEAVLRRALAVEPDQRFPDMGALLAALTAAAAAPSPAPPPRRHRRAATIVITVLAATGALAGVVRVVRRASSGAAALAADAGPTISLADAADDHVADDADRAVLRDVVKQHIDRVSECYEAALGTEPSIAAGTVTIEFEIAASGRVVSTRIAGDDFDGRLGIAGCVAAKTMEWTFPPPRRGGTVRVSYPFAFAPGPTEIVRDGDQFTISRATWESWKQHPGYVGRSAKLLPSMVDKRQVGFKLYAIKPGSLLTQLGFENGDTITHVDGRALDGAEAMLAVTGAVDGTRPVVLQLRRRGATLRYTYRLAPP